MQMKIKLRITPFLLLCFSGGLAIFSSTMAKNPALPLFIRSLGVPVSTVGFIAAASTIVGIVVSLPAGMLSDIIGRRRVLLVAAVVFATAPFLYLLVTAPWHLVVVRIYHGLATAILGPVALAAVADTYSSGRGERIAWYSSATMIGRFLAPFAGGLLIFGDNFRFIYIADGVAGILALLAISRLRFTEKTSKKVKEVFSQLCSKYRQEMVFILRHRGILATSGIEAVQYFAFGCMETYLPIYLNEKLGYPAWQIGILFAVQILSATFTKPIMGSLSDRYGRIPLIGVGLLVGGIATSAMLLWANYVVVIALMTLFGLGLATVTASTSALVADLARAEGRGGAMGVLSCIMDIGQSSGPMVAGILIGAISYHVTFALVGLLMAISAVLFVVLMRYRFAYGGTKESINGL